MDLTHARVFTVKHGLIEETTIVSLMETSAKEGKFEQLKIFTTWSEARAYQRRPALKEKFGRQLDMLPLCDIASLEKHLENFFANHLGVNENEND